MERKLSKALWAVAALLVVNVVLLLAAPALALTRGLEDLFFGPKLVRAEVILQDAAGLHDYRIDRGRIRNLADGSLTLLERDGTVVSIPVSPTAEVLFKGRRVPLGALRRGMIATTVREGDAAAHVVHVVPRR
ncbi:MAG: hypothetical protein M3Q92_07490 [Actinomycetota bacterium]|nr:hypothetical protein [Actinomycetota bacterium]